MKTTATSKVNKALAIEFCKLLRSAIGNIQMQHVIARNEEETDPHACHSHDFCDANEVMAQAWKNTFGKEFDLDSEDQTQQDIWNDAWTAAKKAGFIPSKFKVLA